MVTSAQSRLKRSLLFKLRINLFPRPFYAKDSYLVPISSHLLPDALNSERLVNINYQKINLDKFKFTKSSYLLFAPSAAWKMKRWHEKYWKDLISSVSKNSLIVLVGGPNDSFIDSLYLKDNKNVINLSGKTSFLETFFGGSC